MIPDIIELNFPKIDGKQYATLTHATASIADMGEKTITTQVKIDGEIVPDFSFDWEVEFQGEKYIMPLRIPQGAKENTSLNATIDLTFQHWAIYQLKRWPFVTIQQIAAGTYLPDEEVAPVQLNLKDFCILFGQVLEYYYGGAITIDLNPAWEYKHEATIITISHTKIWNVLIDAFHDKYGVRWEIKAASDNSNTVKGGERYVIRVGYPTTEVDHIFEYGFEGGLLKVERQVQSEEIRNMLKGRGGDKNIPFRYFKNTDPNNPDFQPDPDWVEELASIYFPNLMPATFRSYVQGWKAAHISKYPGYTAVGESNAYAPWAYRKGYTDTKFHPVEFVADEITIAPETGDRQVEILPGYSPYVKKGSSLDKYGPLPDTLDNDDEVYPTLQGTGLDVAIDVEQWTRDDDAEEDAASDAQLKSAPGVRGTVTNLAPLACQNITLASASFTVDDGKSANLNPDVALLSAYWIRTDGGVVEATEVDAADVVDPITPYTIKVINIVTGEQHTSGAIPTGEWKYQVTVKVCNKTTDKTLKVIIGSVKPTLEQSTATKRKGNTFDVWVKNVWNSTKLSTETDEQYADRVWSPRLRSGGGEESAIVFTSGSLALSEDYQFAISGTPVYDTSKTLDGDTSHWRISVYRSDADYESTGEYVPNKRQNGAPGDTFVFVGIEMTHVPYVTDAEIRLDNRKKDSLGEVKEIKPTFVVTTDRVRLNGEGKPDALINQLRAGNKITLQDKRFIGGTQREQLYLQSITYTYREPSSDDAALNPDVEITLGTEYATSANPVSMMQGELSALQRQVGSISNIEQIVRMIGDRLYLRKDGFPDRSVSATEFLGLLTGGEFRAGIVGGAGWGFFRDENGRWVLEVDSLNVRNDMQVNTLVVNQVEGRGGMEISTPAAIEVSEVVEEDDGYVCYFDQKGGSIANNFKIGDVAYCNRFKPDDTELKYYKRRVVSVAENSIKIAKTTGNTPTGWPDSGVSGTGVPEAGDVIVCYGSYTTATRRFVGIRDVIGGGYTRFLEGLDSVNATGDEYFFVGRQSGMYNGRPRFYLGDEQGYIQWLNGVLTIKGNLSVDSTIGGTAIGNYITAEAEQAMSKLTLGTTNLLLNTDFLKGTENWETLDFSVRSRDMLDGRASVGSTATGGQLYQDLALSNPQGSYVLTLYVHAIISIGSGINTSTIRVSIGHRGLTGGSTMDDYTWSRLYNSTVDSSWTRLVLPYTHTSADTQLRVFVMSVDGAPVAVNGIKLERGTLASAWSPSPLDNKYLRTALEESTLISGGLILTSQIRLGYHDSSGNYHVQAGANGVYDSDATGGGIAFWAGGDMIDAAVSAANAARSVMRHDGTGYAAGNTIKFLEEEVRIGANDELRLKKDGMYLYSGTNERMRVADKPIQTNLDQIALGSISFVNKSFSTPVTVYSNNNYITHLVNGRQDVNLFVVPLTSGNVTIPHSGKLTISSARISINVAMGTSASSSMAMPTCKIIVRPAGNTSTTGSSSTSAKSFIKSSNGLASVTFSNETLTIHASGRWEIAFVFENKQTPGSVSPANGTATLTFSATMPITNTQRVEIGNNGMCCVNANAAFAVAGSEVILRAGNYGLKISATRGIQKMEGGVWSSL